MNAASLASTSISLRARASAWLRRALAAWLTASIALALAVGGEPAAAAQSPWAESEGARARLIAPLDRIDATSRELTVALEVELHPGWKTYWRSPGEVGLPPAFDWSGSENFAPQEVVYPAPERFTAFGIENIGYSERVAFPVRGAPIEPGRPVALRLRADLLVCAEICIPWSADFALDLPAGDAEVDPASAQIIARALSAAPDDGGASGFELLSVGIEGDPAALTTTIRSHAAAGDPDVFLEAGDAVSFGKPEIEWRAGSETIFARSPILYGAVEPGAEIGVTVVDGERAASAVGIARESAASPRAVSLSLGILGVAFLGGLILNAMPCVLPVLALKLTKVIAAGGAAPARVRAGFLATSAGIVVSMLTLGGGAIALQAAGVAVGWGMQFQNPVFLGALAMVTWAFALNLFGAFDIALPSAIAQRLPARAAQDGLAQDFAAGALATLLATPCSAPFLGTAVAFALAGDPVDVLAIFLALGIGLAAPFLLVAGAPSVARLLPKPGGWMVRFKQAMGAALAATTLWLLWVLSGVAGPTVAALVALPLLAAAWWAAARSSRPAWRWAAPALAILVLSAAADWRSAPSAPGSDPWGPFAPERVAAEVDAGRVVFVDITADWCLTCKVNKRVALDSAEIVALLSASDVVAMQGDWTRPDETIAAFLAEHGRFGIPFDVVYGPGAPDGVVLPELLSVDVVASAVREARGVDQPKGS